MVTDALLNITKEFIKPNLFKSWIAIYPVDSGIQLLNNRGQEYIRSRLIDEKFVEKRMDTNAVRFWDLVPSLKVKTF